MKISEIYNSTELHKTIVETKTEGWKEITYFGVAKYPRVWYSDDQWFRWPDDFMSPIWRIRRSIYDPNTWEFDYSYPEWNVDFCFKWSDRDDLDYDWDVVISHIVLENWDYLITETWDRIIFW